MPSDISRSLELRRERAGLVTRAREITDAADAEERELTAEEQTNFDALMTRISSMRAEIDRREHLAAVEAELGQSIEDRQGQEPEEQSVSYVSRGLRHAAETFPEFLDNPEWRALAATIQPNVRVAFDRMLRGYDLSTDERRALQVDSDTAGGFLVTPLQMVDRLIQAVDNIVYIRQWATIFSVPNADALGAPSLENDPADPTWTSELAVGSEDSTMSFGRRQLHPHPLAQYIKVSNTLLRKVPSVESLVVQRLGYKFAVVSENAYLNGSGSNQPLGVFTASDSGVPTSRDVSTGNDETSIKFDGLVEAKYTLKPQYWPRARWVFHRDGVKQIAKLKDGEGRYIWRESVRVGEPDRILNIPAYMSEYAPNTFTTGEYVGVLGDWSTYWIADALNMSMQRLVELYAATNQVGLIGRLESDGMPTLGEAFVRVTLG